MSKICKKCGINKPYIEFTKSKNIKDGYENTCKSCRSEARKKTSLKCKSCKETFKTSKKDALYCSSACAGEARRSRVSKKCQTCGEEFQIVTSKEGKHEFYYCSQDCRTFHLKELMSGEKNPNYERVTYDCDGCNKTILVIPSRLESQKHIFCSNDCYKDNIGRFYSGEENPNYNHLEYECENCGIPFKRKPSANRGERVFCSRACYFENQKDREIKAMLTVCCPICDADVKVWRSRLNYSTRVFCSRECANIGNGEFYSGENSPNWNHELTKEERLNARKYEEYYLWRRGVFERDNYTCKHCGDDSGGNLVAHHILNYSEHKTLRTEISNGITLCEGCHKNFHDSYGYTKNTARQLADFLNRNQETPIPQ